MASGMTSNRETLRCPSGRAARVNDGVVSDSGVGRESCYRLLANSSVALTL